MPEQSISRTGSIGKLNYGNMNLSKEMQQRLMERIAFQRKVERLIGVIPMMELITTGGKPSGTFDLRSLNKAIIEKCR